MKRFIGNKSFNDNIQIYVFKCYFVTGNKFSRQGVKELNMNLK